MNARRKPKLFWEPARPPFIDGEELVYATAFRADGEPDRFSTWWFVTVLESEVCRIGAHRRVIRCQHRKADGAPRDESRYVSVDQLFREVRA